MFIFQKQQTAIEMLSGVHGNFKVTKPSKFSGVQFFLKPWLTMVTINFRAYLTVFPTKKYIYYSQSHILMEQPLIEYNPDWKKNWKTKTKNKKSAANVLQI